LSTDPECDSRKLSAVSEFFRFQSLFHLSNPSRLIFTRLIFTRLIFTRKPREERTGGKPQAAFILCSCGAGTLARLPTACKTSRAKVPAPHVHSYCTISAMVPAPTVCPPSRIANRRPFSMATGVISSITRLTLSPGMTISVPAGSSATPVTSVVRK
jgi:hypothetical protein